MFVKPLIIGLVIILVIAIIFAMGGCRKKFAHGCFHSSPEKKADWVVNKITKELDLNEQQESKLNDIKKEILAKKGEYKNDHRQIFDTVVTEVRKENIDQVKIKMVFEDKHKNMEEMIPFVISKLSEFHSVLTPEQREKLANKMQEFYSDKQ
jgi:Spy/CpxP family protein refolding chaperone